MKLFFFLFHYSRRHLIFAILAGIVSGLINTVLLALISSALTGRYSGFAALIWIFVLFCFMLGLTRTLSELLLVRLGQQAILKLRMSLSQQILAVPLRELERIGFPAIMAVLTEDIPTLALAINAVPVICINIAVVLACLVYLCWLSFKSFLVILVLTVLGTIIYQTLVGRAFAALTRARRAGDDLQKHFQTMTDGIKELKLHRSRQERFLSDVLLFTATAFRRDNTTGLSIYTAAASWGQVLVFLVIAVILFAFPHLNMAAPSVLTGYAFVILYMANPLQIILNTMPQFARANVSLKKMDELGLQLETHATERDLPWSGRDPQCWESIVFSKVTHAYHQEEEDQSFTLGPIDFSLKLGELIFVIGGNGSGKTTFAKLLTALYSPESGSIYLDGRPVLEKDKENYRQLFSCVFSDFHLSENLLGLEKIDLDNRANQFLAQLQLNGKVRVEDGTLSTTKLSHGQRKRLALLIAYLENRPIYLFDEWAADQDPAFKDIFYLKLLPELKSRGKTVVVITHDDRFFQMADRIVKLEDGQIIFDQKTTNTADIGG